MRPDGDPPYILLANRDEALCDTLGLFFNRAGWQFDVVADGPEALLSARSRSYDVIITDHILPGLDGLSLLRTVRRERPSQAIIVVSSDGSLESAVALLREGAVDFIQAPVDFDHLERSVQRLVSTTRQEEFERGIYRFAQSETSSFVMASGDLASLKMPLVMIDRLLRGGRVDVTTKLKLLLAFQEALTNALDHGNLELESEWKEVLNDTGLDRYSLMRRERLANPTFANRKLFVTMSFDASVITITIKDEGRGFDHPSEARPIAPSSAGHGRGLAIMRESVDELEFRDHGREVIMRKYLARPDEETPAS